MAATSNHPMERVKMLNMREEALLKRHLDSISTLEKKQLHIIAKDTINLRMELRAHRFRAMKTMVRQKGALQEFDEKWRKRKAAIEREQRNRSYLDESGESVDQSGRRSASSVYERLYHSAGSGYKCPAPPAPLQRSVTSILNPTSSAAATPAAASSPEPSTSSRRLLDRRTPEPARHVRSPAASEPARGSRHYSSSSPVPQSELGVSYSRSSTSSSMSYASTSLKPRPPASSKPPPGAARRASTYRRPSTVQRAPAGRQKDYMETLLGSIVGGPEGTKVAAERGGNGANALLSKLEGIKFNEYTDGSLAMEMRRLKRKSVVHGVLPTAQLRQKPAQAPPNPPPAPVPKPTRLHTAPPTLGVSERKQAQVAAAVAAATTWRPPVVRRAWKSGRGYDSDKGLIEENEGLMKLHREGQRQEYEDVLRRVNAFLGKPTRAGIFLPRDCLSKEEVILLNKVRPPRTRLKGAVKLVMFLNKTGALKALTGGLGTKKTPLGSATSSMAPPSGVSTIPEVK